MTEPSKPDDASKELPSKSTELNFFSDAEKWTKDGERLVRSVAKNLRYGSWTKRFVIVGGISFFLLNPKSANQMAEYFGVKELPNWYPTAFAFGMGGIGVSTLAAAIVTVPKPKVEILQSSGVIKGLQSFDLKDAGIFAKLGRRQEINKYLTALQDEDFRFGILTGDSGCGKSSLLQAGLLPRLMDSKTPYFAVYVKLRSKNVIDDIRKALEKTILDYDNKQILIHTKTLVSLLGQAVKVSGKPVVLIIDQFEQFFSQNNQPDSKKSFILDLKSWYSSDLNVKILIGIRADWQGYLEEIREELDYTSNLGNSFLLKKFVPNQATEVLEEIADKEHLKFDKKFIQEVMECQLAKDGYISPVDVQLLALTISEQADSALREFTPKAFEQCGGVEGLLTRFLDQTLATQTNPVLKQVVKEVLIALTNLDKDVREGALSLQELQKKIPSRDPSLVLKAAQWLSHGKTRLVTSIEGENGETYELAHERLIRAIKQIAGKEISAASKADRLLDERVNKWLGSGKDKSFLFDLEELFLLWKQRQYLIWKSSEIQKKELLKRSWRAAYRRLSIWSTPIVALLLFWGWSNTEPGQMQWIRWQIMRSSRLEDGISSDFKDEIALDLISTSKDNPLLGWKYFGSSDKFKNMASSSVGEFLASANDAQDPRLSEKSIANAETVFGWVSSYQQRDLLRKVADKLIKMGERDKANQTLKKLFVIYDYKPYRKLVVEDILKINTSEQSKKILGEMASTINSLPSEDEKSESLSFIAVGYITLNDRDKAKELIDQAQGNSSINRFLKSNLKATPLIRMAEIYMMLNDSNKSNELLEEALYIIKLNSKDKNNYNVSKSVDHFLETYIKLNSIEKIKTILKEEVLITKSSWDSQYITIEQSGELDDRVKREQVLELVRDLYQEDASSSCSIYTPLNRNDKGVDCIDSNLNNLFSKDKVFTDEASRDRSLFSALTHIIQRPDSEARQKIIEKFFANVSDEEIKRWYSNQTAHPVIYRTPSSPYHIEEAEGFIERSIDLITYLNSTKSLKLDKSRIFVKYAQDYISLGKYDKAKKLLQQSFLNLKSSDTVFRSNVLVDILESHLTLKNYDKNEVKKLIEQSFEIIKLEKDTDSIDIDYAVNSLIRLSHKFGDSKMATKLFEEFILKVRPPQNKKQDTYDDICKISDLYLTLGEIKKAEEEFEKLLLMIKSIRYEDRQAVFLNALVIRCQKTNNVDMSRKLLEQSLQVVKSFKSHDKSDLLIEIALAYHRLEDVNQTQILLKEAKEAGGASSSFKLALAYAKSGDLGEAMKLAQSLSESRKLDVLAQVLRAHAEKQNPEFKKLRF